MVKNVLYVNKLKNIKNNENKHPGKPAKLLNYPLKRPSNWVRQSRGVIIATDRCNIPPLFECKDVADNGFRADYEVVLKSCYLLELEININFTNKFWLEII